VLLCTAVSGPNHPACGHEGAEGEVRSHTAALEEMKKQPTSAGTDLAAKTNAVPKIVTPRRFLLFCKHEGLTQSSWRQSPAAG